MHILKIILLVLGIWTLVAALTALALGPIFRREEWLFGFIVPRPFIPDQQRLFGFKVPVRMRIG